VTKLFWLDQIATRWHSSFEKQNFFFLICAVGLRVLRWPIVAAPDDRWVWLWRNWWNEDWQGKLKYSEKTCPSATLSTKYPTCLHPGLNTGSRGGKPATNRLTYGAASKAKHAPTLQIKSESHSYSTTGGLPPISSSWRQAPWHLRLEIFFFNLKSCGSSPYVTSSLTRRWVCLLWICLVFRQVYISHI
jgi:hypothetical protein